MTSAEQIRDKVMSLKGSKPQHELSPYFLEAIVELLVLLVDKNDATNLKKR